MSASDADSLELRLEGFEGPLDLLLDLARAQKVDLAKISILALVEQYLAVIEGARRVRLELAADWLVMAAWLTWLKSRLHIGNFQIVAEMRIDILMIITKREFTKLLAEAVAAGVVLARGAPAVAPPVAVRFNQALKQRIIGVDGPSFSHGHVMGRIKTGGADMADSASIFPYAVLLITGAKCIAVVLYQPEVALITKGFDHGQVKGIAQCVGHHYRSGFAGKSSIKL